MVRVVASITVLLASTGVATLLVAQGERGPERLRLGALALAVRLVVAILISAVLAISGRTWVFPDEGGFLAEAATVSSGGDLTSHGYSNFLGLLFKVTGHNTWVPRGMNVIAGALLAVVVYELVHRLAGRRPALVTGVAVALWPSLVLWSAVVLKDPLTLLGIFGALLGGALLWQHAWPGLLGAVAAMVLVQVMRPYAFVVTCLALATGAIAGAGLHRRRHRAAPALALVLCLGMLGLVGGHGFLGVGFARSQAQTEAVSFARTEGSQGSTGCGDPETRGWSDVVSGLPRGLACALLGPTPWSPSEMEARVLLVAELPLWYAALVLALMGAFRLGWRSLVEEWLTLCTFALGIVAVLATYERNAGTALRQRSMVIPVALALASTLVARLGHRRRRVVQGVNR